MRVPNTNQGRWATLWYYYIKNKRTCQILLSKKSFNLVIFFKKTKLNTLMTKLKFSFNPAVKPIFLCSPLIWSHGKEKPYSKNRILSRTECHLHNYYTICFQHHVGTFPYFQCIFVGFIQFVHKKVPPGCACFRGVVGSVTLIVPNFFPLLPHSLPHVILISRQLLRAFNVWQRPSCFGRCFFICFFIILIRQ